MRQTLGTRKSPGEKLVKDIKRATRKQYSSEAKIRIVLDGLRGDDEAGPTVRALFCGPLATPRRSTFAHNTHLIHVAGTHTTVVGV